MTLTQRLISFIQENLMEDAAASPLGEHDSLIARGVIDSIGLLQLITFLEEETGVRVPDDDVVPDNFETVARIETLVERLKQERMS